MTQEYLIAAFRLVFSGLKEIFGSEELERLMDAQANGLNFKLISEEDTVWDFVREKNLSQIRTALETEYGDQELRGLLLRAGRASCKYFVRQYGAEMQITSTEYRLLPTKKRLQKGLKAAAGLCGKLFRKEISLIDEGDRWTWQEKLSNSEHGMEECGNESFFTIGLLQEYLAWLSGGKTFQVKKAHNTGFFDGTFRLSINKQPME